MNATHKPYAINGGKPLALSENSNSGLLPDLCISLPQVHYFTAIN